MVIATMDSAMTEAGEPPAEPAFINQVVIDPRNSQTLYAISGFSLGLLKSRDGGATWTQMNRGLRSLSLTRLVIDPEDSKQLFLADGCAGLYVSRDGGESWNERNDGLQNTEIGRLILDPLRHDTLYAVTTTGVFKGISGGKSWIRFNQGDHVSRGLEFISLAALPASPLSLYFGTRGGLFNRQEGDEAWIAARGPFAGKQISALAGDPATGRLYAAIFRRGSLETLSEGGLFLSSDGGKSWIRIGEGLEKFWIRDIALTPGRPEIQFLATTGKGVLRSVDGGVHWKETNRGIDDPNLDIRTLAADRHHIGTWYAGSYGQGVYKSEDGGENWKKLEFGRQRSAIQYREAWEEEDRRIRAEAKGNVEVPASFKKCNLCHGWSDPLINRSPHTLWMVPANRRPWGETVKRMSEGAGLTPAEEKEITDFLTAYTANKN